MPNGSDAVRVVVLPLGSMPVLVMPASGLPVLKAAAPSASWHFRHWLIMIARIVAAFGSLSSVTPRFRLKLVNRYELPDEAYLPEVVAPTGSLKETPWMVVPVSGSRRSM